mgnify:FL=1|tara:strand:- start:3 stop:347 length:345 start_codon:yes stop_codon:yes gene_type:complete
MANFPTTVNPTYGASKNSTPKIRVAEFGSGYSQRTVYGINQDLKNWQFTWENITETNADEIETFLEARGGVESFDYQPQGEASSKKYICVNWSKSIPYLNRATINATFQQVAEA